MNAGELGADIDLGLAPCREESTAVGCARGIPAGGGTFRDRFFAFRAFLLGDTACGEEDPVVDVGGTIDSSSVVFLPMFVDVKSDNGNDVVIGELSTSVAEDSVVDIVVVGEELLEEDVDVDVLCEVCSC